MADGDNPPHELQPLRDPRSVRDHWASIALRAPDRFHEWEWDTRRLTQRQRLDLAFEEIQAGFQLAGKKLKDARRIEVGRELGRLHCANDCRQVFSFEPALA